MAWAGEWTINHKLMKPIIWVKENKLATVLLLAVVYLVVKPFLARNPVPLYNRQVSDSGFASMSPVESSVKMGIPSFSSEPAPSSNENRLVVQESNLSLVVGDVREVSDKIIDQAKNLGGYMISSSLSQPEEAPYATVSVRVPSKDLKTALEYFRSLAVKVSSENLYGTDVTDEYVDLEARLLTLNKTKTKFEEILAQAVKIQDLLEVQRQLINLQDQIDALKGRQQYLEKTAEMARVTLHLSTDEYVLPYAPKEPFRPAAIFKQAVRSLVGALRGVVKIAIWVVVFAVIWLPVLLIFRFFQKRYRKKLH